MTDAFNPLVTLKTCRQFRIGNVPIGGGNPLVVFAGPCVLESAEHALDLATNVKEMCHKLGLGYVFKASYDKANRSSNTSFRGLGLAKGLEILAEVKEQLGVPILTDVHTEAEIQPVAEVVDILQIPAFLVRQTDFVQAVGRGGKPVNVKKAQFMAPEDIVNVVEKLQEVNCHDVLLTERGVTFGYKNLVSDFRSLPIMQHLTNLPVCFDATHSVQQPGGLGNASGGKREFVPVLARAACAVGVNALFIETHRNPDKAPSDGPNMVKLDELYTLLAKCSAIVSALA
ncbi:MAG: 3-deoxy-8-phosphooctulonate synthase [Sumerlaeia bacterium]